MMSFLDTPLKLAGALCLSLYIIGGWSNSIQVPAAPDTKAEKKADPSIVKPSSGSTGPTTVFPSEKSND